MYLSHHDIQLVVIVFHTKLHKMQKRGVSTLKNKDNQMHAMAAQGGPGSSQKINTIPAPLTSFGVSSCRIRLPADIT